MTSRELLGEDHYKLILRDYEDIRARRKARNGKPDQYERVLIELDRMFEKHYKAFI